MQDTITLKTRTQQAARDDNRKVWKTVISEEILPCKTTALLICDVWDKHWCVGAVERLDEMVHRMDETIRAA